MARIEQYEATIYRCGSESGSWWAAEPECAAQFPGTMHERRFSGRVLIIPSSKQRHLGRLDADHHERLCRILDRAIYQHSVGAVLLEGWDYGTDCLYL
jgi:hypothetical protein